MREHPEERNMRMPTPNVLFEKKFPHMRMEDYDRIYDEADKTAVEQFEKCDPKERCKRIFESTVRVMMPERLENRDHFVKMAMEVAEFYEIDTTVTEYEDRLCASFYVDGYGTFSGLKKIILFSDDIGFQSDGETVLLNVLYYTHATYRAGKKISPCNDLHFLE